MVISAGTHSLQDSTYTVDCPCPTCREDLPPTVGARPTHPSFPYHIGGERIVQALWIVGHEGEINGALSCFRRAGIVGIIGIHLLRGPHEGIRLEILHEVKIRMTTMTGCDSYGTVGGGGGIRHREIRMRLSRGRRMIPGVCSIPLDVHSTHSKKTGCPDRLDQNANEDERFRPERFRHREIEDHLCQCCAPSVRVV